MNMVTRQNCAGVTRSVVRGVFLCTAVVLLALATAGAQSNPVVIENQQPGSAGWDLDLAKVGTDAVGQIKGYASAASVNKGGSITFQVSTNPAQTYTIDVYRVGWYQGLGGRLMQHIGPLNGVTQPTCPMDATTGKLECNWAPAYTLATQTSWTSGVYLAVLTNAQGFENYMIFVVRDDSRVAALLYQQPDATYQAYNDYPDDGKTGKSLYDFNSYGAVLAATGYKSAAKVSFDRPYSDSGIDEGFRSDYGEVNFIRWMERNGYDVTYSTDVDTHANGSSLLNYRGLLSVGHDEYWSKPMYDAFVAARDAGVNLGFFGADAVYWQIRFESSTSGVPNRVIVCYRDVNLDPITDQTLKTINWRDPVLNRPEQTLMGVQYTISGPPQNNQGFFVTYVVNNPANWVYAGTGFKNGDTVIGLVGYEADRLFSEYPPPNAISGTYTLLSHSAWGTGPNDFSNASVYQAPSGAWVFATGSMAWNWALDTYNHGYNVVDPRIQQTAANVLNQFVSGLRTAPPTVTSVSPTGGPVAGGTAVTIQGTNFVSGATVSVGGTAATGVTFVSSTTITATTPAHAAGTVSVIVTNPSGQNGTLSNAFNYNSTAPAVNSVAPSAGPVSGGTAITLTGINYAAGATVSIGGTAATGVTVVSSTTITATTPPHAAGAVNVTVTNTDGQSGSISAGFTYLGPAPTVASVTPVSGPTVGGTAITISGASFVAGATVSLSGSAATGVTVVNGTTITATTALHAAGAVSVTVTNSDGQSGSLAGSFTYTASPAPTISSVTPGSGLTTGGTAITIAGANFGPAATVTVGGTAATGVTVVSSTTITATAPAHTAATVSVIVTNTDAQSATLANAFTYAMPTAITFVQVASATPQTTTATVGVAFPNAQTPGDFNVVAVGWKDTTSSVQSVKDKAGNPYLLAIGPTTGTGLQQSIYYAQNIAGGANTVTVTFNQPAVFPDIRILEYRGVNALDVAAGAIGSGTASNSGPATTSGSNELIFGAAMVSTTVKAAGSGFTSRVITKTDKDLAEDRVAATAGPYSATATLVTTGNWIMQMAAFHLLTGPAPSLTTVTPTSGPTSGGTAITIAGANFATGASVSIGGTAATGVSVVNSTTITASTPAHAAGLVGVTVTNPDGQSGTVASAFTYVAPAPTVTGVTPASGPMAGGTAVTISGTGFAAGATATVGGTAATGVVVVNSTTVTATTPANAAGAVSVTVTNADGQSGTRTSAFTYLGPAPTVTGVAPASGPAAGGTAVTIAGTNFLAGATVSVGGTAATGVTVVNGTTITATPAAHAGGVVSVTVTNADGQSSTLANGFTYMGPAPTLTGVAPVSGSTSGGTAVTLTGTNFASGATVAIGGVAATGVTVVSGTTMTATTPAHAAGAVSVSVTNADGQSATLANAFTYIAPAPTVTGVAPASGPVAGGTAVTISGTGFAAGATATLGGAAATGVTVVNSTTITATTPAHAAGAVNVTVMNADGQSGSRTSAFTYLGPAPTVTGVAPASGPTAGGTAVTIAGTNFLAGATVRVGGTAATGVTVVSSTTITATTPGHAGGAVSVTVTNTDTQSGTLSSGFAYIAPAPTVTGVSPNTGLMAGGTGVTITGTNFAAGASVSVGGSAASSVAVVNSATITATTPAHAAGAVSVTVTNSDGQSGTLASAYTYTSTPPVIGFVQVASATPQPPTTIVPVTYPGPETAGDLNVVVVGWNDTSAAVQSVNDSAGNVYSLAIGPTIGTALEQSIYYATNALTGNNTVTVTFNQPATSPDVRILEYTGVSALDVTAGASGTGTMSSSGPAATTTTAANELIVGANTVSTDSIQPGVGFTVRILTDIDADLAEDEIVATTGIYTATAPVDTSGFWVMQMATFKR
jgi:hypothetical protein